MTLEKNELVTLLAKTANMTKQDYIMSKLTDTAIVVQPSTRTYKALKDEMVKVYAELSRIRRAGDFQYATNCYSYGDASYAKPYSRSSLSNSSSIEAK